MSNVFAQVQAFLAQPFKTTNNAGQWFALIGLILVSLYLWHMIARDFQRIAPEVIE